MLKKCIKNGWVKKLLRYLKSPRSLRFFKSRFKERLFQDSQDLPEIKKSSRRSSWRLFSCRRSKKAKFEICKINQRSVNFEIFEIYQRSGNNCSWRFFSRRRSKNAKFEIFKIYQRSGNRCSWRKNLRRRSENKCSRRFFSC